MFQNTNTPLKEKFANEEQVVVAKWSKEQENQKQLAKITSKVPTQIDELEPEDTIEPSRMSIYAPPTQEGDELRTYVFRCMIGHGVETLKSMSQQTHTLYISLQDAKKFCNEALSWLSPTFNLWGPYIKFLERLIMLMAKSHIFLIRSLQ